MIHTVYNGLYKISHLSLFFSYWVNFKGPKVTCELRKLCRVQTNFELHVAVNRIENFTKTPLFSGSAQQGLGSIEEVRIKINQQRKPFQTTTSVRKAILYNRSISQSVILTKVPLLVCLDAHIQFRGTFYNKLLSYI